MKRLNMSRVRRGCAASVAMVIAVTAASVAPATAVPRSGPSRVESTYQGMTAYFSDCPAPPQLGTCIGYSVNAVTLSEEVGRREYHHELVWVDAASVTIDDKGVHIGAAVMSSGHDDIAPRYGGLPANVHIDGASRGRVSGTVVLTDTDGKTHRAFFNVRVSGGTPQSFTDTWAPSGLCAAWFATGRARGVYNDTALADGTLSVDGTSLAPANVPIVAQARVNTARFTGVCGSTAG